MGIVAKDVEVKWNYKTKNWYEEKGYIFTKMGDTFAVKVEDLTKGSSVFVDVKCDGENCKSDLLHVRYNDYNNHNHDGKYYCQSCSNNLFGRRKRINKKILNGNSFEEWCCKNNKADVLDRWDFELNNDRPDEINCKTSKKYYFKCPKGIHESELISIYSFTSGIGFTDCTKCCSFAQWGIDNLGDDFLEKYWDYDKNINIDPWKIRRGSMKKFWVRCQEKDYHGSYQTSGNVFSKNCRCPFCASQQVHPLDSLGTLYPQSINVWSDKNKKSPYEYLPFSGKKVWWKCPDGKHKDFQRIISVSVFCEFRC